MRNRTLFLFFCLILFGGAGQELYAQKYSPRVEQIRREVRGQRDEPAKIGKLISYARQVYREAPELAKEYTRGATVLADFHKTKQKEAYTSRGFIHYTLGEFNEAAIHLNKAATFETDLTAKANLYEKQGNAYVRLGQNTKAVSAFIQARNLYQRAGKSESVVGAYNSLGQVYFRQEEYQKALTAFQSALPLARTLKKPAIVTSINRNIQACQAILQNSANVEALKIESLDVQEQ